jgi:hypothetical protein
VTRLGSISSAEALAGAGIMLDRFLIDLALMLVRALIAATVWLRPKYERCRRDPSGSCILASPLKREVKVQLVARGKAGKGHAGHGLCVDFAEIPRWPQQSNGSQGIVRHCPRRRVTQ